MIVGVAQSDITPDHPLELSGFGRRTQPSTGTLDDIFIKCLYLADGPQKLLWFHADLIAWSPALVQELRTWAKQSLPVTHVILSATHTHSAPASIQLVGCGEINDPYIRWLVTQCQRTAQAAIAFAAPCQLTFAQANLNLAVDRRNKPTAHVDPILSAVEFRQDDGRSRAVLANYAMHPVTLGHDNREVSADWCGAAAKTISAALPGKPITLITNGAAGNLNPPQFPAPPATTYQYGNTVANTALQALAAKTPTDQQSLRILTKIVPIELEILDRAGIEQATKDYRANADPASPFTPPRLVALPTWRESRLKDLANGTRTYDIELNAIQLGPCHIVTVNCEMFSQFTTLVREKTGLPLFTVAYANGAFGYIPTNAAYDEGGYEVDIAQLFYNSYRPQRGTLERLADHAAQLINTNPNERKTSP